MIINAENLILGRLVSFVAKKAMLGEKIDIVNSEKAIILGRKEDILKKYKERIAKGHPYAGPFFPKTPERIVKRTVRGMLPYKQDKGRKAFKNVKCYKGVPESFKDKKLEALENIKLQDKHMRFLTVGEISKHLGGK